MSALARRDFLKVGAAAGGGLVLGFHLPFREAVAEAAGTPFAPNAFIRIGADDLVTVVVGKAEMGQGVYTALSMLVAEDLEADWSKMRVESAPVDPAYNHTGFGMQMTGGSTSVWSSWYQMRKAGATAKATLIAAAAATWKVDASTLRAEKGFVIHDASGRRLSFGALAGTAATMTPPKDVVLKDAKDFKIVGKPMRRLDTPEKVNGQARFGLDVTVPGMLVALIQRPPVFGGKAVKVDDTKAKAVPGVVAIGQPSFGVVVVAKGFWAAKKGRDALQVQWDDGPNPALSTDALREEFRALAKTPGAVAKKEGDAAAALAGAAKKLEAEYEVPYLAHAMMEPLNCVVDLRPDSCEIWTGTQFQTMDRAAAAEVAGLKPEQVQIHTTLLGGGFGRRATPRSDFIREAVEIAKSVKAPVKVMSTREDDIKGGFYRPMWHDRIAAGLDASGKPVAWTHTIVGQSILAGTPFEGMVKDGIDGASVEGAADLAYAVPNLYVDLHSPRPGVPVLWWRSVGHSHTAFVVESFIDELAHAAGKDPFEYRRGLLAHHPRHKGVLELAAAKAGWGKPLPAGRGRGIAVHESFGSFVAQVAEVSMSPRGQVKVHRVVAAVDCGQYVNPDTIAAQIEGGVAFGLSAALHGQITLKGGRVVQSNFHDYEVLRLNEMPEVEVHILPSGEKPGGVGEPGVPPVAPAVANAVFALTGSRVRRLPIRPEAVKKA
ncbi:MAG: twin-arginine translocation pathway signal protein [Acidobacteria bacterium]|nr:MAG: twin-arginine translocation pathway signal protein [Acidobacteriota bacterium]